MLTPRMCLLTRARCRVTDSVQHGAGRGSEERHGFLDIFSAACVVAPVLARLPHLLYAGRRLYLQLPCETDNRFKVCNASLVSLIKNTTCCPLPSRHGGTRHRWRVNNQHDQHSTQLERLGDAVIAIVPAQGAP